MRIIERITPLLFLITLILLSGCGKRQQFNVSEIQAYLKYLNDPENGLVKEQKTGGITIKVKYLPPEYMVWLSTRGDTVSVIKRDSLLKVYQSSLCFVLNISALDETTHTKPDVMTLNLEDIEHYKERVMDMNFSMKEYIELHADEKVSYVPVLTMLENTYGASADRNIQILFSPEKDKAEFSKYNNFDFEFNDEIYSSGIHHFQFERKAFDNAPELVY